MKSFSASRLVLSVEGKLRELAQSTAPEGINGSQVALKRTGLIPIVKLKTCSQRDN